MSEETERGHRWQLASALIEDRRLGWAMMIGGAVYALISLTGWDIFPCPFRTVTTLPCPGCGMTRACHAAMRGDWAAVLRLNPFGPLFIVFWGLVGLGLVLPEGVRRRYVERLSRIELFTRWPVWVLGGMLLYTLTRWFGLC